jgi:23S rRNA pseudouridine1911/1915/1917 synthase
MNGSGRNGPRKPYRKDDGGQNARPSYGTARGQERDPRMKERAAREQERVPRVKERDAGVKERTSQPSGRGADRKGRPAAPGRGERPTGGAPVFKVGKIKGEWMEVRLPDTLAGAPMQTVIKQLPLPPKLASKLIHGRGLLLQGANVRLHLFPRELRDFPPDWMELNILHEDEFTLVINKPAGIEVHPSEKGQRRTLAHAVSAYYEMSGQEIRVRHIHRIDKETTGPVLYAKNEFAHYQFDKAMREKKIERLYLALAEGVIKQDKGVIDKPIGQDRHHATRRRVSDTGDAAVTRYQVVERFADHTLVRLQLETGRTHQIRVHLSAIGHPLAGDGMYGGSRGIMSRQALHGEKLIWHHPWTGESQQVRAPLPDDFQKALEKLRR